MWWLTPAQASSNDLLLPCGIVAGHYWATLSFTLAGDGTGSLQTTDATFTTPNGLINCSRSGGVTTGSCAHGYDLLDGTHLYVDLVTRPSPGSGPVGVHIVFKLYQSGTVSATESFELSNPIIVSVVVAGSGTVSSEPSGISCTASQPPQTSCSDVFGSGLPLTLTAKPVAGSVFVGWGSGICDNKPAACTFSPSASVSLSASFAEHPKPTSKPTATPRATPPPTPTPTVTVVSAAPIVTAGPSVGPVAIAANPSASSAPSVQPVAASSGTDFTIIIAAVILAVGIGTGIAIGLRRRQA